MLFLGRLATRDRLRRFGSNIEQSCVFFPEPESIDHLYFNCRETKGVWHSILRWLGYTHEGQGWNSEKDWPVQELKKKGWKRQLLKIALAETTYALWRARNEAVFNNKPMTQDLTTNIKYMVAMRSKLHRSTREHVCIETLSIK
ncbi:uncharacterized protein LOC131650673 [Vicia villosa]|uniref:uncharacterized protein LOC131650673 n=1 Tax=Vicia villosa TaxID=3911 RepID=UPI00273B2509|nr:uncharacterized protein LOC131650673 [Vicia villosa]